MGLNIQNKINKYQNKLMNSNNLQKSEIYQNKLKYYHRLNKFGGNINATLSDINNQLHNREIIVTERIKNLKKGIIESELMNDRVTELQLLVNELNNINKQKQEVIDGMSSYINRLEKSVDELADINESKVEKELDSINNKLNNISSDEDNRIKLNITNEFNLENLLGILSISQSKEQIEQIIKQILKLQLSKNEIIKYQDRIIDISKKIKKQFNIDMELFNLFGQKFFIKFRTKSK